MSKDIVTCADVVKFYAPKGEEEEYRKEDNQNQPFICVAKAVDEVIGIAEDIKGFEEFASQETDENKTKWHSEFKLLIVSLANFLYKIDLNERDKKLLWKSLRKNKKMLTRKKIVIKMLHIF